MMSTSDFEIETAGRSEAAVACMIVDRVCWTECCRTWVCIRISETAKGAGYTGVVAACRR